MVAKITIPRSVRAALAYNEQKVAKGQACCLLASGYLKEAAHLDFKEKVARLQDRIQLSRRAATNTVHISLNFAPGESLPAPTLRQIASLYMEKIGFSAQPFLVYEHFDTAHPHLHIVTTNIQADGRRISLHNLGRDASEKARRELEVRFGLVRAEGRKQQVEKNGQPQRAIRGKTPTCEAITNVLQAVLPHYKYASLAELNALLLPYGVTAHQGAEKGPVHQSGGLLYQLLDGQGKKVGLPLKASALPARFTLPFLEQRFKENAVQKQLYKKRLQATLDWILLKPPRSLALFEKSLQAENITLVKRQNEEGFIYGLTYIDHRTCCVFNGSELGKRYSAITILENCGWKQAPREVNGIAKGEPNAPKVAASPKTKSTWNEKAALAFLEQLLQAEPAVAEVPLPLRKPKKKPRKI